MERGNATNGELRSVHTHLQFFGRCYHDLRVYKEGSGCSSEGEVMITHVPFCFFRLKVKFEVFKCVIQIIQPHISENANSLAHIYTYVYVYVYAYIFEFRSFQIPN